MQRRSFIQALLGLVATPAAVNARIIKPQTSKNILLQTSPLAGFQYYQGETIWSLLKPNAALMLKRKAKNQYDKHATALYWGRHKLGYIPRRENVAIAQMLDRNQPLRAQIKTLNPDAGPWGRVEVIISMVVE